MQRYESLGPLGEGSYGAVVKCRHRDSGRLVAIKKFLDSDDDRAVKKIALREIKLLRKLRHDNLVNLLEAWRRRRRWYLVFEFVERTLLDDLEQNPAGLDLDTGRRYLFQVLRAAAFCHQHDIIHRDIKPENVLISLGGVVKLCDFGFARTVASPADGGVYTDYVATRWYRAPELLVGDTKYGKPVDVWAIGCLLMETLTGQPLFPGDSDLDQIHHVVRCFGNLTPRHQELFRRNPVFSGVRLPESSERVSLQQRFRAMSPAALDLAQSCLEVDPEERAPCSELLERPLFTQDSFHVRFVDELNAKIQKGHRENSTLPKITKTPRQEADDGDERKRRARDKKQAEDLDEKVNKDQTKGKTNTKPCNAAEPLTKRSKPVGNKVPGPSPTAPKNKQVSGVDSSRSTKPPMSDPPDPSEQTHQRTDECRNVRKDVESEASKTTEESLMETSRSSNPEQNTEIRKSRNNLLPTNSRDCLRSPSKPPGSGRRATNRITEVSSVDPVEETKTTSERHTRSDSGDPGSLEAGPSNPKLSTTTKPNESSCSLPKAAAQSSTNPNASRGDRITTRLPDEKHLTQDTGASPASRAGADDRPQIRGHKEDVKWKVATRSQSTSPSTPRENTRERTALQNPRSVSDKENHEDPASLVSAGTKSKPAVGGTSRDVRSLSRGHFELVAKPLSLGALKTPRVAGAKAATDVDKDRTSVASTRGHGSSRRTLVHHNLTTADLQEEGLSSAPPPPPSPSPAPLFPPPPTGSSAAGGRLTPAVGFHTGTPGIRCMNKIAGQRGALPARQNQPFSLGHVGGLFACERSRLSDHCDLSVGGSGVGAAKKHDARSFPGFEKLGGTRGREHRRQTEQKQPDGPAEGQTSGSFPSGTAAARTRPHRDRTANGLANSMLIHFEGHDE